jgi:hypothetical protein
MGREQARTGEERSGRQGGVRTEWVRFYRVRFGVAVMTRRGGVENGLVENGLMWQSGRGSDGRCSVLMGTVGFGS